jgi:hypothetical protein
MKENPKSKGDSNPHDKEININSMEIPPQKPKPTGSTTTPPPAKPNKAR